MNKLVVISRFRANYRKLCIWRSNTLMEFARLQRANSNLQLWFFIRKTSIALHKIFLAKQQYYCAKYKQKLATIAVIKHQIPRNI